MSIWNVVRRTYRRLTRRREGAHEREAAATLANVSVFEDVSRRSIRALAEAVHARTFRREEFLYYESDPGLGFYVVQSGRVRLTAASESGEPGELREVGPGELFGECALLGDFPRMATAQATAETRVWGFFRPDLKTMRQRHPRAAAAVVGALAQDLARRQVAMARRVAEGGDRLRAKRMVEGAPLPAGQAGDDPGAQPADER
jgi:CRP-like cAMP-binding protein